MHDLGICCCTEDCGSLIQHITIVKKIHKEPYVAQYNSTHYTVVTLNIETPSIRQPRLLSTVKPFTAGVA